MHESTHPPTHPPTYLPSSFNMATTATGSVADRIEEIMKDIVQSHPYGKTYLLLGRWVS